MRIAEYKQIDTERIETEMPVLDADGNETGETETTVKEIPIMGVVYRDATPEEEVEQNRMMAEMPEPEPTIEERLGKLENKIITDDIGNKYRQEIRADGTVHLVMVESYTGELFE